VYAYPLSETSPDVWMLGSSDYGAQLAAYLGLPYAFAYFITFSTLALVIGLVVGNVRDRPIADIQRVQAPVDY
jgi:alkanesulfonate monooxygenase SsuD/methylene tetrahydromethanopterin reductase-like flavin-dependent oxidoreductase (luciferase family)